MPTPTENLELSFALTSKLRKSMTIKILKNSFTFTFYPKKESDT